MTRSDLLIEIGQKATKSYLESILDGLNRQNNSTPAPKNKWTLERQIKHSHEQSELLFKEKGVHWDQQPYSSGYGFSMEEMIARMLQRASLSKKGSN